MNSGSEFSYAAASLGLKAHRDPLPVVLQLSLCSLTEQVSEVQRFHQLFLLPSQRPGVFINSESDLHLWFLKNRVSLECARCFPYSLLTNTQYLVFRMLYLEHKCSTVFKELCISRWSRIKFDTEE